MLSLIAAVGKNRELGVNGFLCFDLPGDLQYFKKTTLGHPVIMGKKTFDSLPAGPLKGRTNYVASHSGEGLPEGVEWVKDLDAWAEKAEQASEEIFVIGGASIYEKLLPKCHKLYLTEVKESCDLADTFFPEFNKPLYKRKVVGSGEDNNIQYDFVIYEKEI